ncbi:MAG: hypothetical protein HN965_06365, partial [Anaerolineae bacterium]|nr:hypothetical protein [Anaerolineae bacterium]
MSTLAISISLTVAGVFSLLYLALNLLETHRRVVSEFPEFEISTRKIRMNKKWRIKITFISVLIVILFSSCVGSKENALPDSMLSREQEIAGLRFKLDAAKEIESKGYTGIKLGEFSMENCSSKHSFGMLFDAKDARGSNVSGAVCG